VDRATEIAALGVQAREAFETKHRAREVTIAGTPAQVASQLAPYAQAGADLIVVVCDPAPTPKSWELLADARLLLTR